MSDLSGESAASQATGRDRLDAVQALRAIAAGLVVWRHGVDTYVEKVHYDVLKDPGEITRLGVPLFFVVSGFIIATTASRLPSQGGPRVSWYFLRRRLIRIVPIYWLATAVYAAKLAAQGNAPTVPDVARSLGFIPYLDPYGRLRPVLPQGWTLDYEMLFYVSFAAILLVAAVRARYVLLFVLLGGLAAGRHVGILTPDPNPLFLFADPRLLFFLGGVALALARDRFASVLITKRAAPLSAVVAGVVAVLVAYALAVRHGLIVDVRSVWWQLPACMLCVAICVFVRVDESRPDPLRTLLVRAGDASYSTYLVHGFVLGPVGRALSLLGLDVGPTAFAFAGVIGGTAAGYVVYRAVEDPLRRWMNRRWGGLRPQSNRVTATA